MTAARRLALAASLVAAAAAPASAPAAPEAPAAAPAPRMHFDDQLIVRTACFSVANPEGSRSVLYGQRFTDGTFGTDSPTIVLVHGIASSTKNKARFLRLRLRFGGDAALQRGAAKTFLYRLPGS